MTQFDAWTTTDMGLAAYLITRGLQLISTKRTATRQLWFVFDAGNKSEIRDYATQYSHNTNQCRQFMDALRMLKTLVHSDELTEDKS